jgi:glycerophosphoryl diester phosphodiesterase
MPAEEPVTQVDVVAHRGASAQAPENTLAAFRRALELGSDWVELDCTLSADRQVVVIHDDTLERTTDGVGPVGERTFDELRALDAGVWRDPEFAGERIPLLIEVLELARGKAGVLVEVKLRDRDAARRGRLLEGALDGRPGSAQLHRDLVARAEAAGSPDPALARAAVSVLRARTARDRVVLQSFSPIVCFTAQAEDPDLRVELLVHDDPDHPGMWEEALRWADVLGVAGLNPGWERLTAERLGAARGGGARTASVWTVDDPDDIRRLAEWGADRVITNRPDRALEILAAGGWRGD